MLYSFDVMKLDGGLRRQRLWAGFAVVLLPLLVLLALQYRWLVKLDQTSTKAHQAELDNYLEAITEKVEYTYRKDAERVLNLPAYMFTQGQIEKAEQHFRKKGVEGAKHLFVYSFVVDPDHPKDSLLYFDPSCARLTPPKWSSEVRAVSAAAAPWRLLAQKEAPVKRAVLTVDERDPDVRILLNPITDDAWRVVGVAGMVLDPEHLRREVLPMAIHKSLPDLFKDDQPVVTAWDGRGHRVFASGLADKPGAHEADRAFSFVFTDWKLVLSSRHATPAQVARRNFLVNIGLSVALAAALLAGIALTLRTASRAMTLSQMKNDFVSNVSHELRTPLASIRVFGELLRLGRVENPDKVREYGEYIETESRRLTQLINNILDFASIESDRKSYHFERACVEEVVAQTLKTFEVRLRQSGFHIAYQAPDAALPPLLLDPGALAQSLSNLLDNAVKYSNGGREIAVSLRREGGWIVIAVQDHGIGIPGDEVGKIFDRFHRVSTGLVHDVKGSGLGLSIVRHIVEAHRGRVTVESRIGEGSTFSIHLPIDPLGTEQEAAERSVQGQQGQQSQQRQQPGPAQRDQPSEA